MKKILLRGPVLTRSGYGEHARFILNALTTNPEFDVYVEPLNGFHYAGYLYVIDPVAQRN